VIRASGRGVALALLALVASAAPIGNAPPLAAAQEAGADSEVSGDDWLTRKKLTGNWRGARPLLSDHGFEPYLTYTCGMWSNLAGGSRTGTEFIGYLDFGLDLDFEKLVGWRGGGFHIDFHWYQGRQPTEVLVGGIVSMAVDQWEASNAFRVFNVYLRQTLAEKYAVEVGQIAADSKFMISRYAGLFLNAAFGDLPTENLDTNTPVYPLAAGGVYFDARPSDAIEWRLGAFSGDAGQDVASNHGFEWKLGNNAGWGIYSELELRAAPAALPTELVLGGYYLAGDVPVIGTDRTEYGKYDVYVMLDQALAVDDQGSPTLGAFARLSVSPQQDRNLAFLYADAGLNVFGPIPTRDDDVFGVAFGILRASDAGPAGADDALPDGQAVVEVTYQAAVAPWLTLQPDFQVLPDTVFGRRDAYVVGLRAVAQF
jgi:porin